MNSLPSPPLQALPHHAPHHAYHRTPHAEPAMDSLLTSAWHSIQQSPPPSLREILDAYRTRGDGDRDMLIAMLNAKSAEDQRIASVASLQRAMLDMYQPALHSSAHPIPPLHLSAADAHAHSSYSHMPSPPHTSYHHSPHPSHESDDYVRTHYARVHHRSDSGLSGLSSPAKDSLCVPSASPARKRRRSRSPAPRHPDAGAHAHDGALPLPPSPYSSASSHSSGGSPRSRESMAIGALLSTHARGEDGVRRLSSSSVRDSH
ncbi:hypothetical protein WOLCODRAFT_147475 [Wolfiporia cocos MD-104 SS10]|uniref:Uncharacterized protein n=1 Tax=Wolfiporia cocos (strain MD-104) TaxID=742152 RepID=A0A2H3J0R1_WOLCO|nr:hypothetical protein WOLCODRAFT_147475 [Wolfiporia cocos MD-104 SS10]